jgi:hypothetical protein
MMPVLDKPTIQYVVEEAVEPDPATGLRVPLALDRRGLERRRGQAGA